MDSLNKQFAAIMRPAFQRHGFASEQLAAQWPAIVGEGPSAHAKPERIKWPMAAKTQGQKAGGTLVLRVPAAYSLDIHYDTPRLIERVNQFLGYGAITAIKVLPDSNEPIPQRQRTKPSPAAVSSWQQNIDGIAETDLLEALSRLGSEINPKGPSHPAFSTGENGRFQPQPTSSRKLT